MSTPNTSENRTSEDLSQLRGYASPPAAALPQGTPSPLVLLLRGVLLRCPYCGRGRLFRHGYTMYERCPVCGWTFEREEGYWTGAMAINLVVTEFIALAAVVVLVAMQVPIWLMLLIGVPIIAAAPFLFYWHAKSLWMSVDFMIHPVEAPQP